MTIREELRGALTNVLSNASNFPERVQTRILGQDMGPLTDKAADAAAAALSNLPGGASDGHHTFDELYDYRMLYNAHAARGWLAAGIPVVKSWRHSDGELCFGGGWFIVTATLPTGQVSNHYQAEHWDLFAVPAVELRPEYDGHTPADAADRLRTALAVFEQAYTPTDNEREALRKAVSDAVYGDERVTLGTERLVENLWAAGFRRTAVQEPSAEESDLPDGHAPVGQLSPFLSRRVQGEPTDAQVVHLAARRGGKTQAMIDQMLAQADERGIRVEVVYPQGEPTDAQVLVALNAWYAKEREQNGWPIGSNAAELADYSPQAQNRMRAALRAAYEEGKKR